MIRMHADAVIQLRDGFSGQPVMGGLLCLLDGMPFKPLCKQDGSLILMNLPEGPHCLSIACKGFREEQVDFTASPHATHELYVSLKPSERYPFQEEVTRLALTVRSGTQPAAEQVLWVVAPGALECKLAQIQAEPGATELRLFSKGEAVRRHIPGQFLLEDEGDSEIILLVSLKGEQGVLGAPLLRGHGRGKLLLPAQRFRTDKAGRLNAIFRTDGVVVWYCEQEDRTGRIELAAGLNEVTLSL